ncbi:uroporphyrinogen-III synthase [Demequina sp. SYSU T00192]|uniref:Uroporphyrinogen-III synthase n=1 Tax=Demequina litoralis TaxID=3051660 RepID=A0ABT8GBN4_9MICO|nr:uroporphyrinogen-III synthase [Demequina sp. SYSU T00192]MDN4476549.1 uroporphyrinogen-III synthase [Demequina sp. SYSU T00192]
MSLAGRRLLVPVTAERTAFADDLAGEGALVTPVAFIAIAGPADPAALEAATLAWLDGAYDWMAVTSRNAVLAMDRIARAHGRTLGEPQPASRVATVGEATRGVCADVGLAVDLVPTARQDARGIVADLPEGDGRVLAPLGNLASPVLERGLARKGWHVDAVEAYRTVDGPGPDDATVAAVADGGLDAVLLTSGSVAERFAAACPTVAPGTRIVAIGRTTEAGARAAGLRVDAVATTPSYGGIRAALDAALDVPADPGSATTTAEGDHA